MPHATTRIILDEHAAVGAVLGSLGILVRRGPGDEPERFFDVLRAMLFYLDEFPEKLHHPKESDLLFPRLARAAPELMPIIRRLEADHMQGEGRVRELQHLLLAWELLGDSRRHEFVEAMEKYVHFYFQHMHVEESQLLPAAARLLTSADWTELDRAFLSHTDPLVGGSEDRKYERLFTRIVLAAPEPVGVGRSFGGDDAIV